MKLIDYIEGFPERNLQSLVNKEAPLEINNMHRGDCQAGSVYLATSIRHIAYLEREDGMSDPSKFMIPALSEVTVDENGKLSHTVIAFHTYDDMFGGYFIGVVPNEQTQVVKEPLASNPPTESVDVPWEADTVELLSIVESVTSIAGIDCQVVTINTHSAKNVDLTKTSISPDGYPGIILNLGNPQSVGTIFLPTFKDWVISSRWGINGTIVAVFKRK